MKKTYYCFILAFLVPSLSGWCADTLRVASNALGTEREVYIHFPEFYKYQSERVKLPVFIILDGQHEWFAEPALRSIQALQFVKEIPSAITVVVPLENRAIDCSIPDEFGKTTPFTVFLTQELMPELEKYNPGNLVVIIGHSLSASYALYVFANHPDQFTAVIAHTPMDRLSVTMQFLSEQTHIDPSAIMIAVGSAAPSKDSEHRKVFEKTRSQLPEFTSGIRVFEASHSTHNGIPIIATPWFLTEYFYHFSKRIYDVARVDENYILVSEPNEVEEEIKSIRDQIASDPLVNHPELPEIYGIASKYLNSGFTAHAQAVYEYGLEYYPLDREMHIELAGLLLENAPDRSIHHLRRAIDLLKTVDQNDEEADVIIRDIEGFLEELRR